MTTIERILNLMSQRNISAYQLEKTLGLSNASIQAWRNGRSKPSTDALSKLADYFDVTVDYLLCRTDDPTPPSKETAETGKSEISFTLYEEDKALLTESDEEEIRNFVQFVVEKRKKRT